MRSTGIIRKLDELGRIVIAKELRVSLGIEEKTPIQINLDGKKVILKVLREDEIKTSGIIFRRADELGRIVIPMEIRNKLNLLEKDSFEIFTDKQDIILMKYILGCIFCSSKRNLIKYKEIPVCEKCINKLNSLKKED